MGEIQRDSIVFYSSFREAVKSLSKKEQLEFYNTVFDYGFSGIEPTIENTSTVVLSLFALVRPQIDKNNQRYINGCKGGRPLKNNQSKTKPKPKKTKPKPNDNVNDNDNVNVNDNISLSTSAKIDYSAIIKLYNSICVSLPKIIKLTDARKKAIKSAFEVIGSEKEFKQFFEKIESSDFLCGRTENTWTGCGFDWILKKSNLIKILEGNYNNQTKGKSNKPDYYDTSRYENLDFN